MIIAVLILLGLCFGSFVNAFIWRLHEQSLPPKKRKASKKELSISKGRSMCVNCGHTLSAADLMPVISWVALRGRCRYCKKSISWQYPAVELATAVVFVISYVFWPHEVEGIEFAALALWLVCVVGLMALMIYDIRWMLLPNKIIFPLYGVAAAFVVVESVHLGPKTLLNSATSVLVGGGLFYILFQISNGRWIGGGDVKLGFLLGALLHDPIMAFMMLFLASLLGTLYILPFMAAGKTNKGARIPFGPFLIAATIIAFLVGPDIMNWYTTQFIDV